MPDTAKSIIAQVQVDLLPIPDNWDADTIKPGHEIQKPVHLFSRIEPEKAEEWRNMFGGELLAESKEGAAARAQDAFTKALRT